MMVRTQISLPPDELRAAKARAAELEISLGELVRRALRRELEPRPRKSDWSGFIGMFPDDGGPGDWSVRHDEIIGEALEEEYCRWQEPWPDKLEK